MKPALLKALAGSSSQNPVNLDVLARLGKKADVAEAISDLLSGYPPSVNTARVMRKGIWSEVYWLTGSVEKFNMHNFKLSTPKQAAPAAKPIIEKKEPVMTRITAPAYPRTAKKSPNGKISLPVLRHIVAHPGIRRQDLLSAMEESHPDLGYRQFSKAIWDLLNVSQTITQQGDADERVYYPANTAQAYLEVKNQIPHVVKKEGRAAEGDLPPTLCERGDGVKLGRDFSLMFSDENCLFVGLGDEVFRLKPDQTERLHSFLNRISLVRGA